MTRTQNRGKQVISPAIDKFNEEINLQKGAILVLDNASTHNFYDNFISNEGWKL